jgi:hypothetical protein
MPRRSDDDDLLALLGRKRSGLSIDDISSVVADALKTQRQQILTHVKNLFELERVRANKPSDDVRTRNINHRLLAVESELRQLKRERGR